MSDEKELSASAEGAHGADGSKPAFSAKKIILIVVPLLLLAGAGGAAYFLGYIGKKEIDCSIVKESDPNYAHCAEQIAKAGSSAPGTFIAIPDMIVNLSSPAKQPRFLKIKLEVELNDPSDQKPFEIILPRVVDQFQTYLRELRVEDLRGSGGMYRMKIELLSRVRAAAPNIAVRDVLFQEILIQ